MNNENNLNNEPLQGNGLNPSPIPGPTEVPNVPAQNVTGVQPQTVNVPTQPQPMPETNMAPVETPKKKKPILLIIIIAVLVVGGLGYFAYTKFSGGNSGGGSNACVENFRHDSSMSFEGTLAIALGDTQYIFDKKFDLDFLSKVIEFDNVSFKICYTEAKSSSVDFQVGEATKSRNVESFELYDTNSNKKINATNINDFLAELGYHSYGNHTEKAKVVEVDNSPGFGFGDDKNYSYYNVNIEFANGTKVEAKYNVYEGQENKIDKLETGKEYTFDFEVKEDTFEPVQYIINDFN